MISVEEAYQLIDGFVKDFGTEKVPLRNCINRILAEDIFADRDFPPFDRVTMDGIAISSQSFATGRRSFLIEDISAAGAPEKKLSHTEHCIEVMTGAILPQNTDAVIPYEQCEIRDNEAHIDLDAVKPFQNVHRKGTDEMKGALLLQKNIRLSPASISVLATVGKSMVEVYKPPVIAICSTGDELVDVEEEPLPHQIRQSNVYFLAADLEAEKIQAELHYLPDEKEKMLVTLQSLLEKCDVILLSGAVSKGKFDFLPDVLESLGMTTVFHRVAQRPGKPFLFGHIGTKLIFGFPGNPVSTFVCYHVFCKRWLQQSLHQPLPILSARSTKNITPLASLASHVLVKINYRKGECWAEPVSFSTSGDISSLLSADGILTLPAGQTESKTGDIFDVIRCR